MIWVYRYVTTLPSPFVLFLAHALYQAWKARFNNNESTKILDLLH